MVSAHGPNSLAAPAGEAFQEASAAFAAAAAAVNAVGGGVLPPAASGAARHEALYRHASGIEARRHDRQIEKSRMEMEECSFRPVVNRKMPTAVLTAKSGVDAGVRRFDTRKMGKGRFDHLHQQALSQQRKPKTEMTTRSSLD